MVSRGLAAIIPERGSIEVSRVSMTLSRETPTLSVELLRQMFRSLEQFRALYQDLGIDTITGPDGESWSLWDLEYLYEESQRILPTKQARTIELFLLGNMLEADVAVILGSKPSNPVGMYATVGLTRICKMVHDGELPRFRGGGV